MRALFVQSLVLILISSLGWMPVASAAPQATAKTEKFGGAVPAGAVENLSKVLKTPEKFDGKTVLVEGRIRSVCKKKGCWMELEALDKKAGPACMVRFKDYGFFMPLDSSGARVRLQGVVKVEKVSKAEVKHLESDGLKIAKDANGTATQVRIVAEGVELQR